MSENVLLPNKIFKWQVGGSIFTFNKNKQINVQQQHKRNVRPYNKQQYKTLNDTSPRQTDPVFVHLKV